MRVLHISILYLVRLGTSTRLAVFLTYIFPCAAPVIRSTLLLWCFCVRTYLRTYNIRRPYMILDSFLPRRKLTYGTGLRLNPMDFTTMSTSSVMLMIYYVYHTTRTLRSDGYRPSSNSKVIRCNSPKYTSGVKSER